MIHHGSSWMVIKNSLLRGIYYKWIFSHSSNIKIAICPHTYNTNIIKHTQSRCPFNELRTSYSTISVRQHGISKRWTQLCYVFYLAFPSLDDFVQWIFPNGYHTPLLLKGLFTSILSRSSLEMWNWSHIQGPHIQSLQNIYVHFKMQ